MWNKSFWAALAERAVKTAAQSLLATIAVGYIGLLDVKWVAVLSTAGLATAISVLTSIISGIKDGNPSAINAEVSRSNVAVIPPAAIAVSDVSDLSVDAGINNITLGELAQLAHGVVPDPKEPDEDDFDVNLDEELTK